MNLNKPFAEVHQGWKAIFAQNKARIATSFVSPVSTFEIKWVSRLFGFPARWHSLRSSCSSNYHKCAAGSIHLVVWLGQMAPPIFRGKLAISSAPLWNDIVFVRLFSHLITTLGLNFLTFAWPVLWIYVKCIQKWMEMSDHSHVKPVFIFLLTSLKG